MNRKKIVVENIGKSELLNMLSDLKKEIRRGQIFPINSITAIFDLRKRELTDLINNGVLRPHSILGKVFITHRQLNEFRTWWHENLNKKNRPNIEKK